MTFLQAFLVLLINAVLSGVVNMVEGASFADTVTGLSVLLAISLAGYALYKLNPWKGLPAVAYVTTIACIATIPGFLPFSGFVGAAAAKVNFVGLCTPVLAYAGLSLGKDLGLLKRQGWRIVAVGLSVFTGTFLGSAIIAEIVLRCMK